MNPTQTPTLAAPLMESTDAALKETLRAQAERHMPEAESSINANFRRAVIKANDYARALNADSAERWKKLMEGL